jgi:acyl carrier protein
MLNEGLAVQNVQGLVYAAITRVMAVHGLPARDLRGDDKLNATLGLRSLDLAELVFELETAFGADPFEKLVPITSVRTVDDLVGAYLRLFDADEGQAGDSELIEAQRASQSRRARRESRQ